MMPAALSLFHLVARCHPRRNLRRGGWGADLRLATATKGGPILHTDGPKIFWSGLGRIRNMFLYRLHKIARL